MSAPLTEWVIETIIRDGLGDLRNNPGKLDDLFSKFNQAFFLNQYGQSKIDELKTFVQKNQIKIVHAFSQVPSRLPCFSIQLISSEEREDDQQFSNEFLDEEEDKTPTVYVSDITVNSYDSKTGKLVVDPATDLSTICPGLVFVDASDNEFIIGTGNSCVAGDKYINIGSGKSPDLGGLGRIESPIDFKRTERKMIRLRERISIGCHADKQVHIAKFLYYILYYILKSRQIPMINRGINLDAEFGSLFDREDEIEGRNVYSRFIEINCLTEFDWDQQEANIIDCFDLTTNVEEDIDSDGELEKINVNTSDDS